MVDATSDTYIQHTLCIRIAMHIAMHNVGDSHSALHVVIVMHAVSHRNAIRARYLWSRLGCCQLVTRIRRLRYAARQLSCRI